MSRKDYRIDVRVYNNNLLSAIESAGFKNPAEFSRAHSIPYHPLSRLIAMKDSPLLANGEIRPLVEQTMVALNRTLSELFSGQQLNALPTNRAVKEVRAEEVYALMYSTSNDPALPDEVLENDQLQALAHQCFDSPGLTEVERLVLKKRFGFESEPLTTAEIGELLQLSSCRILQIEAKALRKLRHPYRSEALRTLHPQTAHEYDPVPNHLPSLFDLPLTLSDEEAQNEKDIEAFAKEHGHQWRNLRPEDCEYVKGKLDVIGERVRLGKWNPDTYAYELAQFARIQTCVTKRQDYISKLAKDLRVKLTAPRTPHETFAFWQKLVPNH